MKIILMKGRICNIQFKSWLSCITKVVVTVATLMHPEEMRINLDASGWYQ
jgi:hypothetical protein